MKIRILFALAAVGFFSVGTASAQPCRQGARTGPFRQVAQNVRENIQDRRAERQSRWFGSPAGAPNAPQRAGFLSRVCPCGDSCSCAAGSCPAQCPATVARPAYLPGAVAQPACAGGNCGAPQGRYTLFPRR